jgi:hypothetical protein
MVTIWQDCKFDWSSNQLKSLSLQFIRGQIVDWGCFNRPKNILQRWVNKGLKDQVYIIEEGSIGYQIDQHHLEPSTNAYINPTDGEKHNTQKRDQDWKEKGKRERARVKGIDPILSIKLELSIHTLATTPLNIKNR